MDLTTVFNWGWLVDGILLAITVFSWRKAATNDGQTHSLSAKYALPYVAGLLVGFSILLLTTPVAYYFSYPDELRPSKGWRAAMDCFSFTLPCLAGVVAGFALVRSANKDTDFRTDPNARYYLGSAIVLMAGYLSYLARHYRPAAGYPIGVVAIYALGPALAFLAYLRYRPALAQSKASEVPIAEQTEPPSEPPAQPDLVPASMRGDMPNDSPPTRVPDAFSVGGGQSTAGAAAAPERSRDTENIQSAETWRGCAYASMWLLGILLFTQISAALIYAATNADLAVMRAYQDKE